MNAKTPSYHGCRFPPEIISQPDSASATFDRAPSRFDEDKFTTPTVA